MPWFNTAPRPARGVFYLSAFAYAKFDQCEYVTDYRDIPVTRL